MKNIIVLFAFLLGSYFLNGQNVDSSVDYRVENNQLKKITTLTTISTEFVAFIPDSELNLRRIYLEDLVKGELPDVKLKDSAGNQFFSFFSVNTVRGSLKIINGHLVISNRHVSRDWSLLVTSIFFIFVFPILELVFIPPKRKSWGMIVFFLFISLSVGGIASSEIRLDWSYFILPNALLIILWFAAYRWKNRKKES